jgi:hypothetical protein
MSNYESYVLIHIPELKQKELKLRSAHVSVHI